MSSPSLPEQPGPLVPSISSPLRQELQGHFPDSGSPGQHLDEQSLWGKQFYSWFYQLKGQILIYSLNPTTPLPNGTSISEKRKKDRWAPLIAVSTTAAGNWVNATHKL